MFVDPGVTWGPYCPNWFLGPPSYLPFIGRFEWHEARDLPKTLQMLSLKTDEYPISPENWNFPLRIVKVVPVFTR